MVEMLHKIISTIRISYPYHSLIDMHPTKLLFHQDMTN